MVTGTGKFLAASYAIHANHRDQVVLDGVENPVCTDMQPVPVPAVKPR